MATYESNVYNSPAVRDVRSGLNLAFVKHTFSAAFAASSSDVLKLKKLPKGVQILPQYCEVVADADPDSGNNATVSLKLTDGTTTKTIISTSNLQAADSRLVASAANIADLNFFKTSSDDFYVYLAAEANDVDSAAVVYVYLAWLADASGDARLT